MEAKEYLQSIVDLSRWIAEESGRLSRLKSTLGSIRSPLFEPNYNTASFGESYHARMITEIMDKEEELKVARERLKEWRKEAEGQLMLMENSDYQLILGLRYLDNMNWVEISEYLHSSLSTVKRWHLKALDLFPVPDDVKGICTDDCCEPC